MTNESEIRFENAQLAAEPSPRLGEPDPWGAEDEDEHAVALPVSRVDDEERKRRRRRAGGMALRGSGTRGRRTKGAAGVPGGAAAGNPATGATVGGVGGPGGNAAAGVPTQPVGLGGPGAVPGVPAGLPGAGLGGRALLPGGVSHPGAAAPMVGVATTAGGPGAGSLAGAAGQTGQAGGSMGSFPAGLMAAGGDGSMTPDQLRDLMRRSGLDQHVLVDADGRLILDPLVDTDGDGIPDTPASMVDHDTPYATTPGFPAPGLPTFGSPAPGTQPAPPPGSTYPIAPPPGLTYPTPPPTTTYPTTPQQPPSSGGVAPAPIAAGTAPERGGGGDLTHGTPTGSWSAGSTSFGQSTPTYSSTGGTDYSVATGELRTAATTWSDVADKSGPMANAISSTPDPVSMFGVLNNVVSPYASAVDTSIDTAVASGNESGEQAIKLATAANNYDEIDAVNKAVAEELNK